MVIPTSVRWHLIVDLIYISLKINNVEHLFICLLVIVCLFWSNIHLRLLPIFFKMGFVVIVVTELYELFVYFGN